MPAAYAHIALVNVLAVPDRLERLGMPDQVAEVLLRHFKFCEFGAVSPDYPSLAISDENAKVWAEYMHYEHTTKMLSVGVRHLAQDGMARSNGLAWLLGYAAHVATDMAIHPIVKLRVGPYYANATEHRKCEMHQDAYIWPRRMNLGEVGLSEHLTSGIRTCGHPQEPDRPDPVVEALWHAMLADTYPKEYAANRPDITEWRRNFRRIVDGIAEEGGRLVPIARHVADGLNPPIFYPAPADVDKSYITGLSVPGGGTQDYDAIFDHALENVGTLWKIIADAVVEGNYIALDGLRNWNLDIGCEESLVYWS